MLIGDGAQKNPTHVLWNTLYGGYFFLILHNFDVRNIVALHGPCRLKSLTTRLFVQQLVKTNNNEYIEAPHYWLLWKKSDLHSPRNGTVMRKVFPCHDIIMPWGWYVFDHQFTLLIMSCDIEIFTIHELIREMECHVEFFVNNHPSKNCNIVTRYGSHSYVISVTPSYFDNSNDILIMITEWFIFKQGDELCQSDVPLFEMGQAKILILW